MFCINLKKIPVTHLALIAVRVKPYQAQDLGLSLLLGGGEILCFPLKKEENGIFLQLNMDNSYDFKVCTEIGEELEHKEILCKYV